MRFLKYYKGWGDGKKEVGKHKALNYRYSKKYVLATALQCYVHYGDNYSVLADENKRENTKH